MGNRGYNAGGFAWMERVRCPLCGFPYPIGRRRFDRGDFECMNKTKCRERQQRRKARAKLADLGVMP